MKTKRGHENEAENNLLLKQTVASSHNSTIENINFQIRLKQTDGKGNNATYL